MSSNAKLFNSSHFLFIGILTFNIFLANNLLGQKSDLPKEQAALAIKNLKDGSLLIRLKSEHKKLEAIQKELLNKNCDGKCVERLNKLSAKTIRDRDLFNVSFIQSMKTYFNFCPVYYFYDKDLKMLKEKNFNLPLYLNHEGKTDMHIQPKLSQYLLLSHDQSPNQSLDCFIFSQSDQGRILPPFPEVISLSNLTKVTDQILYPKTHIEKNAERFARKINNKLWDFYKKF
ncbi:MAG: hypothetical protein M3Q56_09710 [Bacteroidota bacterium]|nr:hypothetical protein [Bacteroidota bacterium]